MAREQAALFLAEMRTNEKVLDFMKMRSEPQDEQQALDLYAAAASAAGYDVTKEELEEALLSRSQAAAEQTDAVADAVREMNDAELDQVAGGYWWAADDSPIDGHELFCLITWHDIDWSKEHDDWCTKNYIFKNWYYKN